MAIMKRSLPLILLASVSIVIYQNFSLPGTNTASSSPFNVDEKGHIVVMEYESLYGPAAQEGMGGMQVHPVLSSADMRLWVPTRPQVGYKWET